MKENTKNTLTPKKGDTIVVWFSCGAASAVAAKKTIEKYGKICKIRIVNNPIKEEDEDNQRFLKDVEKWLGVPIEFAINSKFPNCSTEEVWEKSRYMSGVKGAPCTKELKKRARQEWESKNHFDWLVLGFTAEEKHRYDRFILTERENLLPILIEADITKKMCFRTIDRAGLLLPRVYRMGYPNGNCTGCVKSASVTYWQLVKKMHPDVFERRAKQSREIGCKLIKYKEERMFLDEMTDDMVGRPLTNYSVECGIFCEELDL